MLTHTVSYVLKKGILDPWPHLEDVGQLIVTFDLCDPLEAVCAIVQQHCDQQAVRPQ